MSRVRERRAEDVPAVAAFLAGWHSARVARRGELVHPLDYPALVAVRDGGAVETPEGASEGTPAGVPDGALLGVLTYIPAGERWEILTLHTATSWGGVGSALLAALDVVARRAGCTALHLVTTNDNVDALRFHQRRGFRIEEVRPGAVDRSRREMKPEIPLVGDYGIPIRDEIELVRPVD